MHCFRRLVAATIALGLVGLPMRAQGQPEPSRTPEAAPTATAEVDPLAGTEGASPQAMVDGEEAAYAAFMAGQGAVERGDVDAAESAYTSAIAALPDEPPYGRSRGSLGLRLALVYAVKYEQTGDLQWLAAQRRLLLAYRDRLPEILPGDASAQRDRAAAVDRRVAAIDREHDRVAGDHGSVEEQLAKSLRGEYVVAETEAWTPSTDDVAWYPRKDDPRRRVAQQNEAEVAPEPVHPPVVEPTRRRGVGLVAGGAVALGAGVAGLAVMGVGMARASAANDFAPDDPPADRLAQIQRGENANAMSVVGASVGGALLATGIVLVAIGARRMRASTPRVAFAPAVLPHATSVHFSVRF